MMMFLVGDKAHDWPERWVTPLVIILPADGRGWGWAASSERQVGG